MQYDGVPQFDQSNISQFTQKIPFQARTTEAQLGPKLQNIMSHDSLSEDLLEVLWHDETQQINKSSASHFSKKIYFCGNMGSIWPKITQTYMTLTNCSRDFLETFQHDLVQQLDIIHISQFSKKKSFFGLGQLGQKLRNLILTICSVRIFLK